MRELLKTWGSWLSKVFSESEEVVSKEPKENEVAAAVKTLGWCIFWGLVFHGCAFGNAVIEIHPR